MALALLSKKCEEELICDMAETYHVLNWRELPLRTAAILASGLHEDCRSLRKLRGQKVRGDELWQLAVLDELRLLFWSRTKDAEKGKNQPKSLLRAAMDQEEQSQVTGFQTQEEFEVRRRKIIEGA